MDKEKYYIPDIEDIRIGYECENYSGRSSMYDYKINTLNEKSEYWKKYIIKFGDFDPEYSNITLNVLEESISNIRTPFLTKEQIIAEDWEVFKIWDNTIWWEKTIDIHYNYRLQYTSDTHNLAIVVVALDEESIIDHLFNGECKSINELRTIQKLLKIK